MLSGDFLLLEADADGIVRHDLVQGDGAFAQRLGNRLYAIRGENPFDPTMGLPPTNFSEIESDAVFASFAAEALRNDREVAAIQRVDLLDQTEEQLDNAERPISITVLSTRGQTVGLQAVL